MAALASSRDCVSDMGSSCRVAPLAIAPRARRRRRAQAASQRAVLVRRLGLFARRAAAAVLGLVPDRLAVRRLAAVGDVTDQDPHRAALADGGAGGPVAVDPAG